MTESNFVLKPASCGQVARFVPSTPYSTHTPSFLSSLTLSNATGYLAASNSVSKHVQISGALANPLRLARATEKEKFPSPTTKVAMKSDSNCYTPSRAPPTRPVQLRSGAIMCMRILIYKLASIGPRID